MALHRNNKQGKSYGIVGLGRFGTALAVELAEKKKEILVIDADEERVRFMRDYTENAYVVKNIDKKTLEETGIQNCDVVVVCIGEKMDTSILATLHLTGMGVSRVIAKANSREQGEILKKLGAEVVFPERDMAIRLARFLEPSKIMDYIEINENIDISKVMVPHEFVGKTIQGIDFRKNYGLNIIAVEQNGDITTDLTPDYTFHNDDIIFVIGDNEKLDRFEHELKLK